MANQKLIRTPVRPHPKASFVMIDVSGKQLAMFGVNGDVNNSGAYLCATACAAINAQAASASSAPVPSVSSMSKPVESAPAVAKEETVSAIVEATADAKEEKEQPTTETKAKE